MKKDITNNSHLKLLPALDTTSESESVYSHYGPKSHALITMQDPAIARAKRLQQLSELLNYLEREVATLQFRLLEVCDTLNYDHSTGDQLVRHSHFTSDITGTDVIE